MPDGPFDLDENRELEWEGYAYREDDEIRNGGVGCCVVLFLSAHALAIGYEIVVANSV